MVVVEHDIDGAVIRMAREERFSGFVFDMYFERRFQGLRLLDARDRSYVGMPTIVHTAYSEPEISLGAARSHATLLHKCADSMKLFGSFAQYCLVRARTADVELVDAIKELIDAKRLTPTETLALYLLFDIDLDPHATQRTREDRNGRLIEKTKLGRTEIIRAEVLKIALARACARTG